MSAPAATATSYRSTGFWGGFEVSTELLSAVPAAPAPALYTSTVRGTSFDDCRIRGLQLLPDMLPVAPALNGEETILIVENPAPFCG